MALKTKYGDDLRVEDVVAIRIRIEEQTAHITQSDQFQIGELLNHINEIHNHSITASQIRHLRRTHLLRPEDRTNGDRKVYWFTRTDLQDVLVILTLTDTHHMSLTKAAGLLWEEEGLQNRANSHLRRRASVAMPHNHMRRAQYHLRGRLLEIVLTWLFGERSPYNAVALLRQNLQLHRTNTKISGRIVADNVDWSKLNTALDPHSGDLVISVSREGEVLHAQKGIKWQEFRHYRWYHLGLSGQRPAADYTLIVGLPQALAEPFLSQTSIAETARILTPLLHLCILSQQWGNTAAQANTPLQAMANMIPNIAASWQYCAILTPDRAKETLRFLTHCDHFPGDVNTAAATLSTGKLLSGWTFQTGQDCVVQESIGRDDPRIDHQHEEQAAAGIAVPTVVNNHINGVIYVGSRRKAAHGLAFSPAQIRVLKLLGGIVGEFIERQTIAKKTRQTGLQILVEKPFQKGNYSGWLI
ncbi:MAG: GAF domain-containing protein [Chloroflexi bacterium]|nr:GAF domain-containing protein [Chloroflexota bacterium]